MKAFVNIQIVSRAYNGEDRTDSWALTGDPDKIAARVAESVAHALKQGGTKQIVLNPVSMAMIEEL